jgi:hypothetical protein
MSSQIFGKLGSERWVTRDLELYKNRLTPHLRMYGQQVPNVKETKMLGVVIDSKLNWMPHITQKIAACKKALMMMRC